MNEEQDRGTQKEQKRSDSFRAGETVGEILLASREKAGLTLEDASVATKIAQNMLEYLETDNFDAIPAKVYVKGFLRSYARLLDLDVEYILNKYEVQTGQTHKSKGDLWEIETEVVEEKLRSPKIFRRFILPVAIAIVIIIVLIRIVGRREVSVRPPPSLPDLKETIVESEPQPIETVSAEEKPPDEEPMELKLIAAPSDSCWFELLIITAGEQQPDTTEKMFLLQAGQTKTFQATEAFVFRKVGNPDGFRMELNGKELEFSGEKGRVRSDMKITRENVPRD